ncbi:MAG: hypothetical protein WA181_07620 [Bacillus mycoides]
MEYKINNKQTIYSGQLLWCLDVYHKCSFIEDSVRSQFEEMLGTDILELNRSFEDAYESLLFAAVCELGGHKGHYKSLHQTDLVYQYAYNGMELSIFINHIQEIIESNDKTGDATEIITALQAAFMVKEGIRDINKFMRNHLTKITGSDYQIPFKRFDFIIDEVDKFIGK